MVPGNPKRLQSPCLPGRRRKSRWLENKSHLPLTSLKDGRQRQTLMDVIMRWRPTPERVREPRVREGKPRVTLGSSRRAHSEGGSRHTGQERARKEGGT